MKLTYNQPCKIYKQIHESPDALLCVISTDTNRTQGPCNGDSGAPMFLRGTNMIVGVEIFARKNETHPCLTKENFYGTNALLFI
uniref:CSON001534 protein n=1 Tax=Culicoides sonorensis TaxID=179676 RepID=A0A336KYI8_CULSO